MHFQIQFPVPRGQFLISVKIPVQEFGSAGQFHFRHGADPRETPGQFHHFLRGAGTAVPVPVHLQRLSACLLVLIGLPVFLNLTGHIPGNEMGGRHTGIHGCPVNALPDEVVVREPVGVVPGGHLVGNKIGDPAFAQNLRQNPAVAKDIRQPGVVHRFPKGTAEKVLAVQELPDQALRRRDIAVRLHIHGAHRFKPALCHPDGELLKEFRIVLFQRLIGIGLCMRIPEFRIAVHEAKLNQNGPGIFLYRMNAPPVIGNVQMAVGNQCHVAGALEIGILIDLLLHIPGGLIHAFEGVKIHKIQRLAEFLKQVPSQILIEVFAVGHVHEQNIVIDQGLDIVPPGTQERALKNLPAASGAQ